MIKLILQLLVCFPEKLRDAEFNIEGLVVNGVERNGQETIIGYVNAKGKPSNYSLRCTQEKHQELVSRFRAKLKALNDPDQRPGRPPKA